MAVAASACRPIWQAVDVSDRQSFHGALHFATQTTLRAALRELGEEQAAGGFAESAVALDDLKLDGLTVAVEVDGWFPASFWSVTCDLLGRLAEHASAGAIDTTYDPGDQPALLERITPPSDDERAARLTDPAAIVHSGNLAAISALLGGGADPDELLGHATICKGEVIRLLVAAGASANGRDRQRPLRWAAQFGSLDAAKALLDAGAAVDALDGPPLLECTALHQAVSLGHLALVKLLLDHGASVDAVDGSGQTALQRAAAGTSRQHMRITELLRKRTPGGGRIP